MEQIYDFTVKWCDKFRDQNINYIELIDYYFADDCEVLGFKMDCGHAFSEKYGNAVNKHEDLDRIIDDVTDIPLLGSAIYSRWRYFNHWAYQGEDILETQNRAWFILALNRLALLSRYNPFIFQGTLKKMRIVSNNTCYGLLPEPEEEVEQHITINNEGVTYKFRGSLCADFDYEGTDLSDFIRDTVGMDNLYMFDGNNKPDVINKITLDYHRVTKIKPGQKPKDAVGEFVSLDYNERLIIDRETVFEFISSYGLGEILDPSVYGRVKRRKSEYIFCSVKFDEGYKSYYYLTEDDNIEIGDFVFVPAGKDNHEAVVEIMNIEYFSEENVPMPVEKTKQIIRKCMDEDIDLSQ